MDKKEKKEAESNIQVAIRIRPLNSKEQNSGDFDVVRVQDNLIIILDPIQVQFQAENKKMLEVLHRSKQQRYAFDKIYRNQTSELIYEQTVKPLIKTVISGKNATVFAYGPTGTGKTYTMLGNQQTYGLNVLAIRDIFNYIQEQNEYQYKLTITYVEIYNEMIRDLLVPTSGYLQLREDNQKGNISIAGVTQFKAQSTQQVMNLLLIGNKRRTTEATNANLTSSRSHAVFQINITRTPKTKNTSIETLLGKLSLIDLAGSQRGTVTENRGIRLMEGAKINRSLLALANCINALGDKNKKGFFVPYRDSKLTRLLKDSLGGNCKTVMIANVSPASGQFQETINTLKYANRAKNIKTKAITNKKLVSIHISEYKHIINDLRLQIEQLKTKLEKNGNFNQIVSENESIQPVIAFKKQGAVVCQCGRLEESSEIKKIKEQIFENFNERIQLRRAIMEIEQQNAINILQIKKKQAEINILKKSQPNEQTSEGQKTLQQIKNLGKLIHTLKLNTQKNILKKEITNLQLMESMSSTKKIREQIPKRVKSKQNRQFLEIIIKNHVLQLQNIELQINLQIQEKIIGDLKNMIDVQKNIIEQKGIQYRIQDKQQEAILGEDIQLQIDEDSEGEEDDGQIQEDQQIQAQLLLDKRSFKRNKSVNKMGTIKQQQQEQERRKKFNQLSENFANLNKKRDRFGIQGKNMGGLQLNVKEDEQKSSNNSLQPSNQPNKGQKEAGFLDFNLKGVNVKLNEKVPFSILPKDKKKRV